MAIKIACVLGLINIFLNFRMFLMPISYLLESMADVKNFLLAELLIFKGNIIVIDNLILLIYHNYTFGIFPRSPALTGRGIFFM